MSMLEEENLYISNNDNYYLIQMAKKKFNSSFLRKGSYNTNKSVNQAKPWSSPATILIGLVVVMILIVLAVSPDILKIGQKTPAGQLYAIGSGINGFMQDARNTPAPYTIVLETGISPREQSRANELAGVYRITNSKFTNEVGSTITDIMVLSKSSSTESPILALAFLSSRILVPSCSSS